jgi:hypothetical protein
MKSITFTTGEFKEEKTSAWLVGFIKFTQMIGALDLLKDYNDPRNLDRQTS